MRPYLDPCQLPLMWVGGGLVLPLVLGCGDGPPAAKVPCGPGPCHDTPIGDICPGCAAAPLRGQGAYEEACRGLLVSK